jgi:hypothetical protein
VIQFQTLALEFVLHYISDRLSPQPAGSQDVRLVDGVDGEGWSGSKSDLTCYSSDSTDLRVGVRTDIVGFTLLVGFFPLSKV